MLVLQSDISNMVEECMRQVAQRNDTVRFVKLHNDDAEMEEEGVPDDSELSAVALETAFRRSVSSICAVKPHLPRVS